jgi:hypothetical protein
MRQTPPRWHHTCHYDAEGALKTYREKCIIHRWVSLGSRHHLKFGSIPRFDLPAKSLKIPLNLIDADR